jgi:adenylate kinase family enzyme
MVADPKVAEQRMVKRGRLDDHDDDVVERRYAEYRRSITPTLDYLEQHGVSVHEIDANDTIDEIADKILKCLGLKK